MLPDGLHRTHRVSDMTDEDVGGHLQLDCVFGTGKRVVVNYVSFRCILVSDGERDVVRTFLDVARNLQRADLQFSEKGFGAVC